MISVVLVSRVGGDGAGVYAGDGTFGDGAAVCVVVGAGVVIGAGVVETGLGCGVVVGTSFIGVGGTLGHVEPSVGTKKNKHSISMFLLCVCSTTDVL